MSKTISELQNEAYNTALSKGWYDDGEPNIGERIALMHSELSEALEEVRNGHSLNEIYYSDKGKPEGFSIELADVLVRIFDFCGRNNINLEKALEIKMAYNETRPHKHGGKRF